MIVEFLNIVSVAATFFATIALLFYLQKFTIGYLPVFKRVFYKTLLLGDIVFLSTSVLVILNFVEFYKPY